VSPLPDDEGAGMMGTGIDRTTCRLAMAVGAVAIAADAAYFAFSAVGEPFGSINDVGNAITAVLAGWLAWSLRSRTGTPAAGLSLVGAAVGVGGSWMVLSGTSGWLLAAFVTGVGFALIGPSVVLASRSLAADRLVTRRFSLLGQVSGWIMLAGLLGILPALLRYDNPDTAPAWAWVPFLGWVSAFLLFPAWALWLGRQRSPSPAALAAAPLRA
jgi:hypothetical protein